MGRIHTEHETMLLVLTNCSWELTFTGFVCYMELILLHVVGIKMYEMH